MVNVGWLVNYFIEHSVKTSPDEVRKQLLEAGFVVENVDTAYQEFRKSVGTKKYLQHPGMIADWNDPATAWYPGADKISDAVFWPSLKDYLLLTKKWHPDAVQSIHEVSDKIVAWLQSPWAVKIDTRGLVVGYVQSGKTANFTAVIAKAADAGYRFFIVLAGTKMSLRKQTQDRLDRELLQLNNSVWYSPTSFSDFKPVGNVNFFLRDHGRVLCVVKKNTVILKRLISWLQGAAPEVLRQCPFLIIDDEADEASINTAQNQTNTGNGEVERTAINRHLVTLLRILPKAAYIGYTATPFANVLIDPDPGDLYPRHFIIALPRPDAHFGTERIFGRERLLDDETEDEFSGLDMVRIVPDEDADPLRPTRRTDAFQPGVPPSLQDAMQYFWMAAAARAVRGQGEEHSTMLVHTSQLILVHNDTREVVDAYRRHLLAAFYDAKDKQLLASLRQQWDEEQLRVPPEEMGEQPVSFDELLPYLADIIERTEVVVDNYQSQHRLSYDIPGRLQIAVGGNTLSRGLTLEGLLVSYFIRTARTYDTLLQMGRWFGYRPGYSDLPRIWMTSQLKNYFYDLATVEAEVRQDIARYAVSGITPEQFGIRIRTHPDLDVTASLKMQHAVPDRISFDGKRPQTVVFKHQNRSWLHHNIQAASQFISTLREMGLQGSSTSGHQVFYNVSVDEVLRFLADYNFHPDNYALKRELLERYIADQTAHKRLLYWNVVIRGVTQRDKKIRDQIELGGLVVPLLERARRVDSINDAHIGVLMSRGDIVADLGLSRSEIGSESEENLKKKRQERLPNTGLLIIYPISKDSQPSTAARNKVPLTAAEHVIGLGLVFPSAAPGSGGQYGYVTVNPAKLRGDELEWEVEEEVDA